MKGSLAGGAVMLTARLEDGKPILSGAEQGPGMGLERIEDPVRAVSDAADEGRESHDMGHGLRAGGSEAPWRHPDDWCASPRAVVTERISR